ncbi:hypothetical protein [Rhizobium changzhiense]|uniref:hypothetical protein n=1 Tax=Rhizobium changzhiense TaxID=2692317 RepID=UPI001FEE222A|nr:hypothetical protein [Rhizobium changzhiense]
MITVQGQLLEMLQSVANALGEDLRKRLVFVGGCTTALFITDPVTIEGVRTTDDVDLIVDLEGFSEWAALLYELRQRGFSEAADETVICRMRLGPLKVDFMPDDEAILGFSNRWYAKGIETATQKALNDSLVINILTPPLFIATKLEAFTGRGNLRPRGQAHGFRSHFSASCSKLSPWQKGRNHGRRCRCDLRAPEAAGDGSQAA